MYVEFTIMKKLLSFMCVLSFAHFFIVIVNRFFPNLKLEVIIMEYIMIRTKNAFVYTRV